MFSGLSLVQKILGGVMAAALLAAIATAGVQTWRLKSAQLTIAQQKTDIETLKGNVDKLSVANLSNQISIDDLHNQLETCTGQNQAVKSIADATTAELQKVTRQRDVAQAQLRNRKETSNANDPTCKVWSHAATCGGASDWLRDRWAEARSRADQDDREAGAAVRADPGAADDSAAARTAAAAGANLSQAAGQLDAGAAVLKDCYSNGQNQDALDAALGAYTAAVDQLVKISELSDQAAAVTPPAPPH